MRYKWDKVELTIRRLWEDGHSAKAISRQLENCGYGLYPSSNVNSFVGKFRGTESELKRRNSLSGAKRASQSFDEKITCPLCEKFWIKSAWNNRFCQECRSRYTSRQLNRFKIYGIKPEQFDSMFESQNGRCRLCDCEFELGNDRAGPRNPCIDHCHRTKRVRGILCMMCNWALERVEQDGWMDRAQEYLK